MALMTSASSSLRTASRGNVPQNDAKNKVICENMVAWDT